jgi:hypothetical protein
LALQLMRSLRDAFAERGGSIADKPAMIISVQNPLALDRIAAVRQ